MKKIIFLAVIALTFLTIQSKAANSYQCAKGTVRIDFSLRKVFKTCGRPSQRLHRIQDLPARPATKRWLYMDVNFQHLTIDFVDDQVVHLLENDGIIKKKARCAYRGHVQLGDKMPSVMQQCGPPHEEYFFKARPGGQTVRQLVWVYANSMSKPVQLIFVEGRLKQITGVTK